MDKCLTSRLDALKKSGFRSKFFLSEKDIAYVREKGMDTVRRHAADFISSRIAPAYPKNDGRQTPMKNHPVFIAQHATATCCRGCIARWHQMKKDRPLTDVEIRFVIDLVMAWIALEIEKAGPNDG